MINRSPKDLDRLIRVIREEERNKIIGIIEFYESLLGTSSPELTAKHILDHVIKTVEHNSN